jgi:ssDNA-binding Zn-finger/Zn-ribbon topoisomerase 1
MVVRLGRNGRFLACSLFPEHKESRPLPGEEEEAPALPGVGEPCPKCGETDGGVLVARRGRFGPFVGCARYPDCDYIKKDGPPPPEPLPFEVVCPKCGEGRLTPRRARRTGSLFWGCSRYPKCDFTTSHEPLGATHDADAGPVARKGDDAAMCLQCGSTMDLPAAAIVPGTSVSGGPPDPAALARPSRGGRGGARGAAGGARSGTRTGRSRAGRSPTGRRAAGRSRGTERAPGA